MLSSSLVSAGAHPEDLLDLFMDPGRGAAGVQPQRSPAVGAGLEVGLAALLDSAGIEEVAGVGEHVLPLGLQLQRCHPSAAGLVVRRAGMRCVHSALDRCDSTVGLLQGSEYVQTPGWQSMTLMLDHSKKGVRSWSPKARLRPGCRSAC